MIAGAKEVGISPSVVGSFPRKEAALVEVLFGLNKVSIFITTGFTLLFIYFFKFVL